MNRCYDFTGAEKHGQYTAPPDSASALLQSTGLCYTRSMKLTLNRILAGVCLLILLAILVGTAIFFATRKARPGIDLRRPEPMPTVEEQISRSRAAAAQDSGGSAQGDSLAGDGSGAYTSLGQIRATTMAHPETAATALVIVEPWFSYASDDPAFAEELDNKRQKIRSIFLQLFASHTFPQLRDMGEARVKALLLDSINRELIFGKISAVFFEEYLFLE